MIEWTDETWNPVQGSVMLHEETADVLAAIAFVIGMCGLDEEAIIERRDRKVETFKRWHLDDPEDRDDGIEVSP